MDLKKCVVTALIITLSKCIESTNPKLSTRKVLKILTSFKAQMGSGSIVPVQIGRKYSDALKFSYLETWIVLRKVAKIVN
eukprot:snap_masked-scaffold_1-processed-gene-5.1-mRNA-1 protein AED:1.00 eAED:1.00 QI:0/0/0/0/1/1/2/0/79